MKREKLINNGKEILIVSAVLCKRGSQKPYFSITSEIWRANKNGERIGKDCISCGCQHDAITSAFPDFADFISLHLSDIDGVPMHAIENGWYWNGGTIHQEYNRKALANHLRISEEQADALHEQAKTLSVFTEKVNEMLPRWKDEANAVIEKYALTVENR